MSPRYTDERLLNDLKLKAKILGRLPTKEEVDEDKNMANSSTYYDRFGGIYRAAMLIDLNPDKPCELSLELFIKFAKEFYATNGRSPKTIDFDNNKKFPHSCYIREVCKLSWNEFLKLCELPLYDYDEDLGISKLRKTTLQVIDILRNKGYQVDDMGEISTSTNIHLIINEKIKLSIKTSGIKKDQRQNYWKFHVKNNSVIQPDYLLLIGYKTEDFSDEGNLFLVPFNDVKHIKTISVNVDNMDNSKYAGYYIGPINNIKL